ncbi:MAG: 4-diphosphocytidyl-2-C-methyl-D-erythritol kinase [Hydrogenibacillus schlegelii]|uniref:4-diphosphocytidyl-2-C-methyl-D-erythritol kinase n=2 Tax=Hydrogenibacillus schlegelii TaxID=1484 RepID=A0A2T5GA40_HYDSH|nr:MAG: 4-diphosphocytidyl-2-C-methyl-D-erythritol kinase [Hydrogenibacillus schlegelii]
METKMRELWITSPAKINLTLEVLGRRPDGYHELDMLVVAVDLADRLRLVLRDDGAITLSTSNGTLPLGEKNLAVAAARKLQAASGVRAGVHIEIEKRIPISAGLGGGSSNAAAVLMGLNALWGLGYDRERLQTLGAEIGSDVPFFFHGGTARVQGRGERVEPLPDVGPWTIVIARPPLYVSTADVFRALAVDRLPPPGETAAAVAALQAGRREAVLRHLRNDLEAVTFRLYPEVRRLKEKFYAFGAEYALMSGSGPVVYGVFPDGRRARRVVHSLRGFLRDVYLVQTLGARSSPRGMTAVSKG